MKLRLLPHERDILAKASLLADKNIVEIAKTTKHKIHTVRYLFEKLKSKESVRRSWIVDLFRLGWQRYSIIFAIRSGNDEAIKKFFSTRKNVIHFGDAGSSYDYMMAVIAQSIDDVIELLEDASTACKIVFSTKRISVQNQVIYFGSKSLTDKAVSVGQIEIGNTTEKVAISDLEHRILESLMKYPDATNVERAQLLKVSLPTIHERLKSLKSRRVIAGARFSYKSDYFGTQKFKFLIKVAKPNKKIKKTFFEYLKSVPCCSSVRAGLGDWDIEINLEAYNRAEIIRAKRELWTTFGDYLAEIELLPSFSTHRYVTYPAFI